MKPSYPSIAILLVSVFLMLTPMVSAQGPVSQNQGTAPSESSAVAAEVPRLIKFSGTLLDAQNRPLEGPVGVTFALYAQQSGDAALWLEAQNVKPDGNGDYTVLLGANSAKGVPMELFTSGEARWLGVQVERDVEQSRVLLVSVPYALKAGDAETLGGLPSSAFARVGNSITEPSNAVSSGALLLPAPIAATASSNASTDPNVTTLGGTVNFVPKFDTASDVKTSQIFDNGTDVGIGFPVTPTPAPVAKLDINGSANIRGTLQLPAAGTANATTKGFNSQPFDYLASVFNGTAAVNQHFRWQAEPVNPGLSTATGKLNLLFASGTGTPAETGFSISSKGIITFAAGQTLPAVTGNETVTGNVSASQLISTVANGTAPLTVTSATQVPNLNASFLRGLAPSAFASSGRNLFVMDQSITTSYSVPGASSLSVTQNGTGNAAIIATSKGSGPALFLQSLSTGNLISGSSFNVNKAGTGTFTGSTTTLTIGDVGCGGGDSGHGSAGIQIDANTNPQPLDCTSYNLLGDGGNNGNTFINSTGFFGQIKFRNMNRDMMIIKPPCCLITPLPPLWELTQQRPTRP